MRITLIMIILLPLLAVASDLYILRGLARRFSRKSPAYIAALVLAVLFWIAVAVILIIPKRSEGSIVGVMWGLYTIITILIPQIIYVVISCIGLLPCLFGKRYWPTGKYIGLPLAIIIFCAMWWGATYGRRQLDVVSVAIESPRIPKAFDGYRIVQFSDAHVGSWGNDTTFVSTLVDSINALQPDIILFTGDIVNRESQELLPFVNVLSRLHAKDGVYSILGNHDYGDYKDWISPEEKSANLQLLKDLQKRMGWHMLNNQSTFIKAGSDSIALIGVENWGEPPFKQYGDLNKAYSCSSKSPDNVNDNKFKILLTHNPEHWNQHVSYETNIDLTLSGHTHAMQMELGWGDKKWSPAMYVYEQWGGMFERMSGRGTPVRIYVNIGCGEVGMPYRIGADSEITLLTLKKTAADSAAAPK